MGSSPHGTGPPPLASCVTRPSASVHRWPPLALPSGELWRTRPASTGAGRAASRVLPPGVSAGEGTLSAPVLEQLLVAHLAHLPRGDADHERARRDVLGDDRAGCDERLLADLDTGDQDRLAPHPAGATERRSLKRVFGPVAAHRVVVRRRCAGADEDVVLDHAEGREVDVALDLAPRADHHVVVDRGTAADDRLRADHRALADLGLVADDRLVADHRARVDDRARAHRDAYA